MFNLQKANLIIEQFDFMKIYEHGKVEMIYVFR